MTNVDSLLRGGIPESLTATEHLDIRDVLERLCDELDGSCAYVLFGGVRVECYGRFRSAPRDGRFASDGVPYVERGVLCVDGARRDIGVAPVRVGRVLARGWLVLVGPEFTDRDVEFEMHRTAGEIERILAVAHDRS